MFDRQWLMRRAAQAAPLEACGFIMENGEIIEIRNVSLAPMRAFKMDWPQAVEKIGDRPEFISGIWHTHPSGTTEPSHTDLDGIKLGAIARHWDYYIVTASGVYQYDTKLYAPVDQDYWLKFAH